MAAATEPRRQAGRAAEARDLRVAARGWTVAVRDAGPQDDRFGAEEHYVAVALEGPVSPFAILADARTLEAPAPAGSFAFLPAGTPRRVRATRLGRTVHAAFTRAFVRANSEFAPLERGRAAHPHVFDPELVGVAAILSRALRAPGGAEAPERIEPLVRTLLTRLVQCMDGPAPPDLHGQTSIQAAIDHIDANLSGSLTLAEIAARVGSSQYHFARHFRQIMGTSVHRFVVARRCARAEHMLQRTGESIAQIAYEVGFGSQSHMTTVMRRQIGRTPGQIRKAAPPLGE